MADRHRRLGLQVLFAALLCGALVLGLLLAPHRAAATIEPAADSSDEFKAAIARCLQMFEAGPPETQAIIKKRKESKKKHVIKQEIYSSTLYPTDAELRRNGKPGPGSGTTVNWNDKETGKNSDGEPSDPCASLLHELKHAADADMGMIDDRETQATGLSNAEVDACREENRYRKSKGLQQRTKYGGKKLPDSAIIK